MNVENAARKIRMKKGIYLLPNLFTSASLFCGFYSAIASFKEHFVTAAIAILVSVIFDGLDGRVARLTNTTSKFGAEYDSLADVISFGIAPALLAYSWSLSVYGKWGWVVAFLFVLCGALRLARYNIQIGIIESKVFNGLPIPAAASVIATTVIFFDYVGAEGKFHNIFIMVFVIMISLLMVSSVKYYSFKDMSLLVRKPFTIFFWSTVLLIIIVAEPEIMFFVIILGYALSGPVWWLIKFGFGKPKAVPENKNNAANGKP
ncbi:MAG TPA: CDP-diacylglycerol--serine O-phosphatidyltransferase [Smithella sp.]|jgi:CDP-diacylglycerol--serine O-phosphatidyltransferase|nr:CDP-diacylglycerol--serine O-phosphatidyltransferase [Smithella sp.]OQC54209.1 MAG: CDP-alcohol phosphatidyltransferase [Deltaproteobacteria bacterium ADurb.Bin022]HNQ65121.1 CDP-diacylglycerol--serine O-phosphatidyltransferase [Smithella sp.]HOE31904.1 CDP-diacylglycerol--serine O-phosphatidyltransferase [Smithella sp.]HOG09963.1 CDP-diacylglycerol--serine O-phosphatidyltransferase [Smithella sp.]